MNANPDSRTDYIAGLRELADFLAGHPEVPLPEINRITLHDPSAVAAFIDGLDTLDLGPVRVGEHGTYVDVIRRFDGVEVRAFTRTEHVGWVEEVPTTAVKFVPATPDIIRAGMGVGAENGVAGTAPTVPACDPLPAHVEAVTAP